MQVSGHSLPKMDCADSTVSGEAPEIPVLSRTSGNIFEKRLLDSYVAEHGKDPTNGEEMGADDIVEIKTSRTVRPRPPTATSIPSLLSIFQNEWDSLALETYQIRQQLYQTRQELSTALYQHDAACRVIARITKERDEAREALSKVSQSINGSNGAEAMETDVPDTVIPQEIQEVISATLEQESATRKKRKVPEGWTTAEQLAGLKHIRSKKADTNLLDEHRIEQDGQIISRHPSGSLVAMSSRDRDWTVRNSADSEALVTIHNNSGKSTPLHFQTTPNSCRNHISLLPSRWASRGSRLRGWQCEHLPPTHRQGRGDFRTRTRIHLLPSLLGKRLLAGGGDRG